MAKVGFGSGKMKEQTNIYGTTGILFSKSGGKKPTKGLLSIAVIAQKSSGDCSF